MSEETKKPTLEKLKALQLAMDKIEKDHGKGTIMRMSNEEVEEVEVISSGSLGLDAALGVGGYPRGRVIEIYGPEASGKTTLAIHAIAEAPTPTKWVVVTAEPITDVDTTAADMLAELDNVLHESGMALFFAEMKDPVKDMLKRYGLFTRFGEENFFPTIEQAVERYLTLHKIDWPESHKR